MTSIIIVIKLHFIVFLMSFFVCFCIFCFFSDGFLLLMSESVALENGRSGG